MWRIYRAVFVAKTTDLSIMWSRGAEIFFVFSNIQNTNQKLQKTESEPTSFMCMWHMFSEKCTSLTSFTNLLLIKTWVAKTLLVTAFLE